jgi:hypothetical protein
MLIIKLEIQLVFYSDTISDLDSTVLHYTSELKAGSEVMLFIADSAGNEAWSGNVSTH